MDGRWNLLQGLGDKRPCTTMIDQSIELINHFICSIKQSSSPLIKVRNNKICSKQDVQGSSDDQNTYIFVINKAIHILRTLQHSSLRE